MIKRIMFSSDLLLSLMEQDSETVAVRCVKGLPPGTRMVGATVGPHSNDVTLWVEHPDFEGVPDELIDLEYQEVGEGET